MFAVRVCLIRFCTAPRGLLGRPGRHLAIVRWTAVSPIPRFGYSTFSCTDLTRLARSVSITRRTVFGIGGGGLIPEASSVAPAPHVYVHGDWLFGQGEVNYMRVQGLNGHLTLKLDLTTHDQSHRHLPWRGLRR